MNNRKKGKVIYLVIFLIIICVITGTIIILKKNKTKLTNIESNDESIGKKLEGQNEIVILSNKEGSLVKNGDNDNFIKFRYNKVDGKDVLTLLYDGYIFKEDINGLFVNYSDEKKALVIANKEKTWNALLMIKDGSYESRLEDLSKLDSAIKSKEYEIVSPAHEEIIGENKYIVIEYLNENKKSNYVVYTEFLDNKVIGINLNPNNNEFEMILQSIYSFIATAYKAPETDTIKYLDYEIEYKIPKNFVKTYGLISLNKPTWTYSKYNNGKDSPTGYKYSIGIIDEKNNLLDNVTLDYVINLKYEKYKRWKDEEYYLNMELGEIGLMSVNGKDVKYFTSNYDLEYIDGLRKQQHVYFVYPVNEEKRIFLSLEAESTSGENIDFNEIKTIIESIKQ